MDPPCSTGMKKLMVSFVVHPRELDCQSESLQRRSSRHCEMEDCWYSLWVAGVCTGPRHIRLPGPRGQPCWAQTWARGLRRQELGARYDARRLRVQVHPVMRAMTCAPPTLEDPSGPQESRWRWRNRRGLDLRAYCCWLTGLWPEWRVPQSMAMGMMHAEGRRRRH